MTVWRRQISSGDLLLKTIVPSCEFPAVRPQIATPEAPLIRPPASSLAPEKLSTVVTFVGSSELPPPEAVILTKRFICVRQGNVFSNHGTGVNQLHNLLCGQGNRNKTVI